MTVSITREFCESDRFHYDHLLFNKGFAQLATMSDASYFGNWASAKLLVIFSYVEGDCITTKCDTKEEFHSEMMKLINWHNNNDRFVGIDPVKADKQQWIDCNLSDYLH